MTEADWQRTVIDTARLFGWRVAHFRPARTKHGGWVTPVAADGKGFPDLVLARDRVIFAELKTQKGKPTPDQDAWARAITAAGLEMYLWRPSDLEDVANILRRRGGCTMSHPIERANARHTPTSVRT